MKTYFIKLSAFALFFVFSTSTHANFVDLDTYTTDTETGLDWLKLNNTVRQAYSNMVIGQESGGRYEGWRFATENDVLLFLSHYTASYADSSNDLGLIEFLGQTDAAPYTKFVAGYYAPTNVIWDIDTDPDGFDGTVSVSSMTYVKSCDSAFSQNFCPPEPWEEFISAGGSHPIPTNFTQFDTGWLMVRDSNISEVPIPPGAFLFAPGLFAFLGFRRKTKKVVF